MRKIYVIHYRHKLNLFTKIYPNHLFIIKSTWKVVLLNLVPKLKWQINPSTHQKKKINNPSTFTLFTVPRELTMWSVQQIWIVGKGSTFATFLHRTILVLFNKITNLPQLLVLLSWKKLSDSTLGLRFRTLASFPDQKEFLINLIKSYKIWCGGHLCPTD